VDLAGFSSDAPVDTASHFPPPKDDILSNDGGVQDPFDMTGFGESLAGARTRYHTSPGHLETTDSTTDSTSDDILGILAQPVETFTKPKSPSPKPESPKPSVQEDSSDEDDSEPRDKAIAAIVEMGFSIGQATKALSQTPSGLDVQAALDNLLSRPSSSASARLERPPPGKRRTPDPHARQRQEQQYTAQQKDISQIAGEVKTSLLKGAGSLWKSGREKMNTFIHEYQGEQGQLDPSVPKWMRDQQRHASGRRAEDTVTEEARALEARDDMRRPITRRPGEQRSEPLQRESSSRSNLTKDRNTLRKQAEEEAETAYRSSARRRPPPSRTGTPSVDPPSRTATPSSKPVEVDLFSSTTEDIVPKTASQRPSRSQTPQIRTSPTKPSIPKSQRAIPPTSDSALSSSYASRQKGSDAFKVGDYTLALTHYTSALTPLPSSHPQRIIILSNRAITNIKLGDAKAAVTDCDDLLQLVGPSRGDGETVMDMDGPKNLRDIWGKGILRRAAALEMQEKYQDALDMWKQAVDAGIGGPQSLEGRRRCENALGAKAPAPKAVSMGRSISTPQRTPTPVNQPLRSSTPGLSRKSTPRPMDTRASDNLAQHNKTVAAEENEKTRLYDTVDTKVTTWQNGKELNIRALLSSLDLILWPEAGWKKVGMAELVMVNKVKIVYMKAIAKVHPDKVKSLDLGLTDL
jgi:hypothetical protein